MIYDLSIETIRANAHVDPQQQIDLARYVRLHARELQLALLWRGEPSNDPIYKVCDLLFDTLWRGPRVTSCETTAISRFC